MVKDEELCSCKEKKKKDSDQICGLFILYMKLLGLAVDHSQRTKRFTDELTLFTHSGTLRGLKVRHEYPPRVTPQLDADFKLNYPSLKSQDRCGFFGRGILRPTLSAESSQFCHLKLK